MINKYSNKDRERGRMIWWEGSHDANSKRVFRDVLWIR